MLAAPMAAIHITDIESAINWWRERHPSPDGLRACDEVLALAEVYALMVYHHEADCDEATMPAAALAAWLAWYATTPDAPCIAICSTAQGDAVCKGCGRTEDEVRRYCRSYLCRIAYPEILPGAGRNLSHYRHLPTGDNSFSSGPDGFSKSLR